MALRAAKIDAYRSLGEMIDGVQIEGQTTVKDMIATNDEVSSQVSSLIKGAEVLKEKTNSDGSAELVLGLKLNGENSLSEALNKNIGEEFKLSGLLLIEADLVEKQLKGVIDWGDDKVLATGIGFAPKGADRNAARLLARRAAIVDAQRNLAETVSGVAVDSKTSVQNLMLASDEINSSVNSFLKGFKIVKEKGNSDGSYNVMIGVQLRGKDELSGSLMTQRGAGYTPTDVNSEGCTGLIIDASGLEFDGALYPLVYDADGNEIYGAFEGADADYIMTYGTASYEKTEVDALMNGRAGVNPLAVKAIKASGDMNKCNLVVSNADAETIKAENAKSDFIKNMRVVIII
jgi:hypothetical protein